jgi:hypothetical protein
MLSPCSGLIHDDKLEGVFVMGSPVKTGKVGCDPARQMWVEFDGVLQVHVGKVSPMGGDPDNAQTLIYQNDKLDRT